MPTDVENDPFLLLLTDACAGPGSPEWRDAVAKLKSGDGQVDEYRLLIEAREALESGKDYRSVRAGPGFTRKLLSNLEADQSDSARRAFPLTGFIAGLAVLVIAAVVGIAIHELSSHAPVIATPHGNVDELANTYLPTTVLATDFDSGIPAGWRKIGSLPVEADKGLVATKATVPENGFLGGGIVLSDPIPADQTFSVSITLQIHSTGTGLIPQIFVANSPDFSSDRATAAQELVWELEGAEQKVVVGGRVEEQAKLPSRTQSLTVRIILNKDLAIVESTDGESHRLWSGPHTLGDQPRYFGVRFIRTGGKSDADVSIQSVRIQKR